MTKGIAMDDQDQRPLSFRELLGSVLAAALGVQSSKNRTRDFSRGKPSQFIMMGILFTMLFGLCLFAIVLLVTHLAGI